MLPSRENKKIGGVENCHFDVSGILKTSKGRSTEESTSAPSCSRTSRARGQHRSVEGVAWTNGELFGRQSRKLQNRIRGTSQSGVPAKSSMLSAPSSRLPGSLAPGPLLSALGNRP